jgi:hypothetical protein
VATGTITVTAPTGTGLTYSIDGTNYQSSTTFSNLVPGSYNVTVMNTSGCISPLTKAVINAIPTNCGAGIFHTAAGCSDFKAGGNGQALGQICYTTKAGKVSNVTPGQYFYYTYITAPSVSFCIDVIQTKSTTDLALFSINQGNQMSLFDVNCTNVASGAQTTLGNGRICISNAVPGAKYVLSVKYDSKSVVGSSFSGAAPLCTYSFISRINGADQPNTATSINMVPGCTQSALIAEPTKPSQIALVNGSFESFVTSYPNPYMNEVNFRINPSVSGKGVLEVYDLLGRKITTVFEGNMKAGVERIINLKVNTSQRQPLIYQFTIGKEKIHGKLLPGGLN